MPSEISPATASLIPFQSLLCRCASVALTLALTLILTLALAYVHQHVDREASRSRPRNCRSPAIKASVCSLPSSCKGGDRRRGSINLGAKQKSSHCQTERAARRPNGHAHEAKSRGLLPRGGESTTANVALFRIPIMLTMVVVVVVVVVVVIVIVVIVELETLVMMLAAVQTKIEVVVLRLEMK
ncbi:unnamed protein product [Protopolystoma xenopodis]|uniref:Uncharacterized protein n=1 Tax=Protopolystoma xenopodis TaxID=117903 RepID=A0A3S5C265_9PLAT|nr:unnamed protein product [Protopolystoma xenopodis]